MTAEALAPVTGAARAPQGPLREFWGYFSANRGALAGLVIVVAVLLMAAFADFLAPWPPDLTNNAAFLKPPAWQAGGSTQIYQEYLSFIHNLTEVEHGFCLSDDVSNQ